MPPFAKEEAVNNGEAPLLSVSTPYESAREYVRRHCTIGRLSGLYFHGGEFWRWNGRFYEIKSEDSVRSDVYEFLNGADRRVNTDGGVTQTHFNPNPRQVSAVIDGLKSGLFFEAEPPWWMPDGPDGGDLLVFKNGLLNVVTGKWAPLSSRLWVQGGLDYEYDPSAKCSRWEQFLWEILPGDQVAQDCIEEEIGYGMTLDTRFEKAFCWYSRKPRCGKGTLAHVWSKLVGKTGSTSLSFHTWVRGENSREVLVGKRLAIFPDVRLKPEKWWGQNYDPGGLDHQSTELVLSITGRDIVSVPRKYKIAWVGRLPTKLTFISNDILNFQDESGVLPTRLINNEFGVSFLNREDIELKDKLEAELPGIANRCLSAYRRLVARGRFVQPESGVGLQQKIKAKVNDYTAFLEEQCVVEQGAMVPVFEVYWRFQNWCESTGRLNTLKATPKNVFKGKLKEALGWDELRTVKPHGDKREYVGLRLKNWKELEGDEC